MNNLEVLKIEELRTINAGSRGTLTSNDLAYGAGYAVGYLAGAVFASLVTLAKKAT